MMVLRVSAFGVLFSGIAMITVGFVWAAGRQDEAPPAGNPKPNVKASDPARRTPGARELLRRAADAAIALGPESAKSWAIAELAQAQAEAGDLPGSRATFVRAVADAVGREKPDAWDVWQIAHFQVEAGDKNGAKSTLAKAVEMIPVPQPEEFDRIGETLRAIIQDQVRVGDEDAAKRTLGQFDAIRLARGPSRNPGEEWQYIAALALAGKVDDAFAEVENLVIRRPGSFHDAASSLGEMAEAMMARDRDSARPVIERIAKRMAVFDLDANEQVHALSKLSRALAYVGKLDEARKLALSIGLGKNISKVDVTDTQPYTLLLIANEQVNTNDLAGAKETLRMALQTIDADPKMRGRYGRYMQVASRMASLGDIEPARRASAAMGPEWRDQVLSTIAQVERARGEETASKADFALAIKAARDDADVMGKYQVAFRQIKVAQIQAMSGDIAAATSTLSTVPMTGEPGQDNSLTSEGAKHLAMGLASSGDLAGAVAYALAIDSPEKKRKALEGTAMGYYQWKLIAKAK